MVIRQDTFSGNLYCLFDCMFVCLFVCSLTCIQVPKGMVQTGVKAFTKATKVTKAKKTLLVDQMKERIRTKSLILSHEKM